MKQETKSALARQRILETALAEFSARGYEGASLNTAFAENGISKGLVYHHFKDKNELYLLCVERCFNDFTAYLRAAGAQTDGTPEERLERYFDARMRFFTRCPQYLGIFVDAALQPPPALREAVGARRERFDQLNLSVLRALLAARPLRAGLSPADIAGEFRVYMDYFNLRFRDALAQGEPIEQVLRAHEQRCRRQVDILLHGVFAP